ncbi:MAG TPA: peptide chain release factor N(5)-glutamine methyltransferase [Candidatus Sulfotelmatobacter sp.]|nr:peptide chain release factor N(5)-glutamine methyltransferase [Candidatus Sulfotelmatobacter sp.]
MSAPAADLDGVLRAAATRLNAVGIESARLDARVLIAHALGVAPEHVALHGRRTIAAGERRAIAQLIERRARREPVSRIVRRREFWSLPFRVTPATLDPRPDSETVVAAALDAIGDRGRALHLLDLGTGTGCLLLALLSELRQARGLGVDVSGAALKVARANAEALGLKARARFRRGVWADGLRGRYDVIVSNPPYIPRGELAGLPPEVGFDPTAALDGGVDGLAAYRAIAGALPGLLAPGGVAALEIGAGQAGDVAAVLTAAGLGIGKIVSDLANNQRVVVAVPR